MKLDIITLDNKKGESVELKKDIFGLPLRKDILQRTVEWQRAKKQAGTHDTKLVNEIRGTTAKPFRQKGTGNARQGSKYSAQMRGGGTAHGPTPRSHAYDLPKKFRKLALKTALSAKQAEGQIKVIDTLVVKDADAKTAKVKAKIEKLGLTKPLFVRGDNEKDGFYKSVQNIPYTDVIADCGLNVYDILRHGDVVITTHALKQLEERLGGSK